MLHHFSEALEGFFGLAEKGIDAGNVVENGGFFGIDGEGAVGPVVAFCVLANARESSGAQVERARVVRVILGVFLNQ